MHWDMKLHENQEQGSRESGNKCCDLVTENKIISIFVIEEFQSSRNGRLQKSEMENTMGSGQIRKRMECKTIDVL